MLRVCSLTNLLSSVRAIAGRAQYKIVSCTRAQHGQKNKLPVCPLKAQATQLNTMYGTAQNDQLHSSIVATQAISRIR